MYLHRHDDKDALAVWLLGKSTEAEWDEHFDHLRELATWSKRTGKRAACVLITTEFERPDAKRRTELATLTDAAGYDPYVALVSANAAVRSVLTIFKWVQRAPKYEMDFFAKSTDAVSWLGTKRGGRLVALERMVRDVEREASASAVGQRRINGG